MKMSSLQNTIFDMEKDEINWKDRYVQLSADFDNYRKNKEREIENIKFMANKDLIIELLPIMDCILLSEKNEEEIPTGVNNIFKMFVNVLDKNDVTTYGKVGDVFSEALHDAVSLTYGNNLPNDTISEVFKCGYTLKDNIIRHAQVAVEKN